MRYIRLPRLLYSKHFGGNVAKFNVRHCLVWGIKLPYWSVSILVPIMKQGNVNLCYLFILILSFFKRTTLNTDGLKTVAQFVTFLKMCFKERHVQI